MRATMAAKASPAFFRLDLPDLTPLISQFNWEADIGVARLTTKALKKVFD
jgi:hypothetical protein